MINAEVLSSPWDMFVRAELPDRVLASIPLSSMHCGDRPLTYLPPPDIYIP
jgi:hypothetical protein